MAYRDFWTDHLTERLRADWDDGLSTAAIGRRLGTSKNSIVGKAHRLHLPARPSPIRSAGSGVSPRADRKPKAPKVTLPPLFSDAAPLIVLKAETGGQSRSDAAGQPIPGAWDGANRDAKAATRKPVGPGTPPKPETPSQQPKHRGACQWPLGEPGTPSFRFCDAPAVAGLPYCEKCAEKAYPLWRERRRTLAAAA